MKRLKKILFLLCLLFFMAALGSVASADTIAYWRFDDQGDLDIDFSEGLATEVAAGNPLPDINAQEGWDSGLWRRAATDWSGKGNHLTTWDWEWAGWMWASEIPAGIVPETGELNTLGIAHLSGCCPACFTWSAQSNPTPAYDIEDMEPAQFTVEASFYLTADIAFRTIVGRDAQGMYTGETGLAAFYLQVEDDANVACKFIDVNGFYHEVRSPSPVVEQNRWYNIAAVSDGSTLSLYLEDCEAGTGMQFLDSNDLTLSDSINTALTNGKMSDTNEGADWHAGTWTVGRGMYDGGHTDRWFGYIDEVRISNTALTEDQFLFYPGPSRSYAPHPNDGAIDTSTSVTLSWSPSIWAEKHDVYFGTDFDAVSDANRANQSGVMYFEKDYVSTSYPLPPLATGEYYWRIDDVNDDTATVAKGAVWGFVIVPLELTVEPIHRYSFIDGDTVSVDDIGGQDGTLENGASISDNTLELDGTDDHVVLSASGIAINTLPEVTLELWSTRPEGDAGWAMTAAFGDTWTTNGTGRDYLFIATQRNDDVSRGAIANTPDDDAPWNDEVGVSGSEYEDGLEHHYVFTVSSTEVAYYIDGIRIGSPVSLGTTTISGLSNQKALLGASVYDDDGTQNGSINEFRIYDKALTLTDVAASYLAGPDVYRATNPSPVQEEFTSQNVTLSWDAGAKADKHDVYLDTDKAKVVDANRTNYLGLAFYSIDQEENSAIPGSLTPGETYYWKVDEVNDPNIWRGNIWTFTVSPLKASEPSPYNGKICVFNDPCTVLSWKRGNEANQSKLYFGTNEYVLTYVTTIIHDGSDRYSYEKTGLSTGTDYFWRVDEVNDGNTWEGDPWQFKTIPVITPEDPHLVGWWKFDEGPENAIDWSGLGQHGTIYGGAESVEGYDEGGISLDGDDDHVELPIGATISTLTSCTVTSWVNFKGQGTNFPRIFDFGNDVNEYMFMTPSYGWTDGPLRFGITLTSWDGDPGEFAVQDPAGELLAGWHHVAVAIDADYPDMTLYLDGAAVDNQPTSVLPSDLGTTVNNWLGKSQYASDANFNGILDDFRIYDFAMTEEDLKTVMASKVATLPDPANYSTGADRNPVLSWQPGRYAASTNGHELYYSTDYNDVNDRVGDPVVLTNPTYTIPGPNAPYESLQTVFWVVDEVNPSHPDLIWPGNIWRFTIKDYSVIDDFELYTDTGKSEPPPEDTLKSVWVDGNYAFDFTYQTPGTSGSLVQLNTDTDDGAPSYTHYVPDDEDIAQSGAQSMKFYYDNDGTVTWEVDIYNGYPPDLYTYTPIPDQYLSEAYAAIDDAAQTDPDLDSLDLLRDFSGYNVLGLSFYGDPNNDSEPMYVGLEDADGTVVTIQHPNPDLTKQWWQDWYIALSEFTDKNAGLDLENIVKVYLGFGDKDSPSAGGTGVVFFDDIQLFTGVCIPDLADVTGDLDGDCAVNNGDLRVLTNAEPWYGEKPVSLPTPIINLNASAISQALGTQVTSWSNSAGSMGGAFTDFNVPDGNAPVLEMVEGKKAVTFSDINDMLIWDQNAPGGITGANDFTVILEVFNIDIGAEEWVLAWTERSEPTGTFAAFGYGTNPYFGAAAHWADPDMGFGPVGVPAAHTWHTIACTYDGSTESIVVDGLVYDTEAKVLAVEPDQPVVIGGVYEPAEDGSILGAWNPNWALRYIGSVASIKVYDESIPAVELALWMGSPADMRIDNKIDFKDVAVLGNNWLVGPVLFGE